MDLNKILIKVLSTKHLFEFIYIPTKQVTKHQLKQRKIVPAKANFRALLSFLFLNLLNSVCIL